MRLARESLPVHQILFAVVAVDLNPISPARTMLALSSVVPVSMVVLRLERHAPEDPPVLSLVILRR